MSILTENFEGGGADKPPATTHPHPKSPNRQPPAIPPNSPTTPEDMNNNNKYNYSKHIVNYIAHSVPKLLIN